MQVWVLPAGGGEPQQVTDEPLGVEAFQFATQYHKVPSELLIFPDENHWVLKPKNVVAWYEAVLAFLAQHMT